MAQIDSIETSRNGSTELTNFGFSLLLYCGSTETICFAVPISFNDHYIACVLIGNVEISYFAETRMR